MALSGNYDEFVDGFQKDITESGITITRKFHDKTEKTGSLPQVGDFYDAETYPNLAVRKVSETYLGTLPDHHLYVVEYDTSSWSTTVVDTSPEKFPINGNMSGEILAIDGANSGYKWASDSAAIDQTVHKKIVSGSFIVTRRVSNLLLSVWAQYDGRINSTSFAGIAASFVLFEGVDWEEFYDSGGNKKWKVNFNFSYKLSDDGGKWRGWNYLYREATNTWEYTSPVLYLSGDFNKLIADKSV